MKAETTVEVDVLSENKKKLKKLNESIQAANERRRKLIESSKLFTYDVLCELYGLEGQELIDAVTAEHALIGKLTESGLTYEQIGELVDGDTDDTDNDIDDTDNGSDEDEAVGQTSFFGEHSYSD